jgi:phytoene/squalene synthetase
MTILDRIERADYDVFTRRPSIGLKDKIAVVTKAAIARYTPHGKP